MQEEKVKPVELTAGAMMIGNLGEYVLISEDDQLEFHILKVAEAEGTDFYTKLPDGSKRLVVTSALDSDVDGVGQQYMTYFNPAKGGSKPNGLAALVKAVFGEVPTKSWDAVDLLGLPFRATVVSKPKADGGVRQQFSAFFKPAKTQKKVDISSPDTMPSEDQLADIFASLPE